MNLPNKLTVLRVILIPVFLVFMLIPNIPNNFLWAFIIFVLASLTDTLDGYIARKYNLVTNFGKLMDPLADKLLVMSALICLTAQDYIPVVVTVVILSREFLVTSIRLIAAGNGTVIAADKWGKMKTASQMIWLSSLIFYLAFTSFLGKAYFLCEIMQWVAFFFTVFSGYNYIKNNINVFKD